MAIFTKALAEKFFVLPSLDCNGRQQPQALGCVPVLRCLEADDLQQSQHPSHLKKLSQKVLS